MELPAGPAIDANYDIGKAIAVNFASTTRTAGNRWIASPCIALAMLGGGLEDP